MKNVLNAVQAKRVDQWTIDRIGVPSEVLMERAALHVAETVKKLAKRRKENHRNAHQVRILAVCGSGNNGADGVAAARILTEWGIPTEVMLLKKTGTKEFELQVSIASKSGVQIRNKANLDEYDIIIDGIFGIGLSRDIEGNYAGVIRRINQAKAQVVAIDISSGIDAGTGRVRGAAVRADVTVTFGCAKCGLLLYPGADYVGKLQIADVGFSAKAVLRIRNRAFMYDKEDLAGIPVRKADSNKGTFGKVLLVAGSENMGGAACLAGLSAYKCGVGLVKIITHENNRTAVLKHLPEAVLEVYGAQKEYGNTIKENLAWATCIVLGPGLGRSEDALQLTTRILAEAQCPVIIDADALNLIAEQPDLQSLLKGLSERKISAVVTPHMGEMSRLTGRSISQLKEDVMSAALRFAKNNQVICVLKDARTVVAAPDGQIYINVSGNAGMATAGSGDVLTGAIAGMYSNGMKLYESACMGVFLHGAGGDVAAKKYGSYGVRASDIIDGITTVMQGKQK